MLCDDLHRESVAKGSAGKNAGKSAPQKTIREVMAKAGLDADKVTPFTGKQATPDKPAPAAEPREHIAMRVARAIGETKAHAQGKDLNGPVTEQQLKACHALSRAGEMSQEEVADVEKAMKDGRALPLYIIKKLGSGNT
ncbi:hypothetical protein [Paraburkholderia nemoris]|uniref:hypothetical protein n=1 Tax=Paraburkholderia nemoris TaxID=2793076 RepID=UPI001B8C1A5A|nr:hypothetical protein [Paraburkholderia nemoris]